ncbi:MAG: hypothetical protein ACXV5N_10235 [Halobacteriota archaeon]
MSKAAQLMNSNKATVSRHMRNCFPKKVAEWVKPEARRSETLNVINELVRSHENVVGLYEQARAREDIHAAIKALEAERRHLELVAKLTGQLSEAPHVRVNFLLSPEYLELKQTMIQILEPYPELRQEIAEAFIEAEKESEYSESKHT